MGNETSARAYKTRDGPLARMASVGMKRKNISTVDGRLPLSFVLGMGS